MQAAFPMEGPMQAGSGHIPKEEGVSQNGELKGRSPVAPPPLPLPALLLVQEHLLIRSDKSSTGFKGVFQNHGRFMARCDTPPCRNNHLGTFDTSQKAAQAYLQHWETDHPDALKNYIYQSNGTCRRPVKTVTFDDASSPHTCSA
jgi:hypothetical protein